MMQKIKIPKWMASKSKRGDVFIIHSRFPYFISTPMFDGDGRVFLEVLKVIEGNQDVISKDILKDGAEWYFFKHMNNDQ